MSYKSLMRTFGLIAMLAFVVTTLFNIGLWIKFVPGTWEYSGYLLINVLYVYALIGIYFRQYDKAGYLGFAGFLLSTISLFIAIIWTGYASLVFPVLRSQFPDAIQPILQGPLGGATMINMYLSFLGSLVFFIATLRAKAFPVWAVLIVIAGLVLSWLPLPFNMASIITSFGIGWLGYSMWTGESRTVLVLQTQAAD